MCLAVLALDQHPRYPLVVAANRDEFFYRLADPLDWWSAGAQQAMILGGRDRTAGGTWAGLTQAGRWGLVTNVRSSAHNDPAAPSRGDIVPLWLRGDRHMSSLWPQLAMAGYNGFNLLAADFAQGEVYWLSNGHLPPKRLGRGLYGLSNAQLDTPWPKVLALKAAVHTALKQAAGADELATRLFAALESRHIAADEQLPSTGVPLEWERLLSAAHVLTGDGAYGTRSASVLITEVVNGRQTTQVFEHTFGPQGQVTARNSFSLANWPPR